MPSRSPKATATSERAGLLPLAGIAELLRPRPTRRSGLPRPAIAPTSPRAKATTKVAVKPYLRIAVASSEAKETVLKAKTAFSKTVTTMEVLPTHAPAITSFA